VKGLDDGPDGLNEAAFDRALRAVPPASTAATDAACAKGDATYAPGVWVCNGCGKTFKRSPNQHIYAARKRLSKQAAR